MNRRALAACSTIVALALLGADDPDPTWSREFAAGLDRATYAVINAGVNLYNQGDASGCYRLYQGALIGLGPVVRTQSEPLGAAIDAALAEADAASDVGQKAMALRKALDRLLVAARKRPAANPAPEAPKVAVAVKPPDPVPPRTAAPPKPVDPLLDEELAKPTPRVVSAPKPEEPEVKSDIPDNLRPNPLWARLGGTRVVKTIVSDFLFKAANDPRVKLDRGKGPLDDRAIDRYETRLVEFLSSKSGGPLIYLGQPMKAAHATMAIKDEEFDAMIADLEDVLIAHKVPKPEAEELLKMVRGLRSEVVTGK